MKTYLDALRLIRTTGTVREDRTGTGTIGLFGMQQRYDLSKGFPAVTTKKLAWKAVVSELLWFIEGSGNERRLREILHGDRNSDKSTIWTANANAGYWASKAHYEGDVGRIYGVQWRRWAGSNGKVVDQLADLVHGLKNDPFSRRHIISAWNPVELDQMALPPCHIMAQFYVSPDNQLSCQMYQRSADFFLGVPFNIASYALFTHMLAQVCGYEVGEFIHVIGDAHIYLNHLDAVDEQLSREPMEQTAVLSLNASIANVTEFSMGDIALLNYESYSSISAPMAV